LTVPTIWTRTVEALVARLREQVHLDALSVEGRRGDRPLHTMRQAGYVEAARPEGTEIR
jgi:hypothetical protein